MKQKLRKNKNNFCVDMMSFWINGFNSIINRVYCAKLTTLSINSFVLPNFTPYLYFQEGYYFSVNLMGVDHSWLIKSFSQNKKWRRKKILVQHKLTILTINPHTQLYKFYFFLTVLVVTKLQLIYECIEITEITNWGFERKM